MDHFEFWKENLTIKFSPPDLTNISEEIDSLVIVSPNIPRNLPSDHFLIEFFQLLSDYEKVDKAFYDTETFLVPKISRFNSVNKLVYSPTGPLNRDYDDVRRFADAALKGVKRILKAGGRYLMLAVVDSTSSFQFSDLVGFLGGAEAVYVPLEIREAIPHKCRKLESLAFSSLAGNTETLRIASAIEMGRIVCRDIGGSDPERMAAPNVALYVQETFANTCINVEVIESETEIQKRYPLLAAVNRAARGIERHRARVIHLTYEPEGPYDTTLVLVGKGVTYDTGGADVKINGAMAGMHRDKCGAAFVAGFFQTVAALKPKKVKVLGAMAMVRNSIGPDAYVTDEIITSRAGARVRVGNTDAEGRMAMADVLCEMKEKVLNEKNPHLFTIATLTGHALLAAGDGYSIILDNGPAKAADVGLSIQKAGEQFGDPFELSTLRREDYDYHKGKSEYEDLLQCGNAPSSRTPRGHQTPAAFIIMSSGLDKHGINSPEPLKYCHVDIAASAGPFPGIPTGAPIPAFTKRFLID